MRRILLAVLLVGATSLAASETVRILVPIYLRQPVAGAAGSRWQSTFAVHNPATRDVYIAWCSPVGRDVPCVLDLRSDEVLTPGETQTALPLRLPYPAFTSATPGIVMYANNATPDGRELDFQLRVRDLERNALSTGTEVPVVRGAAFRSTTVRLLSIPVDSRFRSLLRIYEMNLDRAQFTVRVFDQATGVKLTERLLTLETPTQGFYRFEPGYAQVGDLLNGAPTGSDVRIEIQPLSAGSAFWAFVSITNNESQEFTVISPQ